MTNFDNLTEHLELINEISYPKGLGMGGKYAKFGTTIQPLRRAAEDGDITDMRDILQSRETPDQHELNKLYRELLKMITQADIDGDIERKRLLKNSLSVLLEVL